ncbi:hypothetical protein KKD52_18875 [Myxococcota bacterium]|nr:hypothetical protein [Myxococcota bacterium]MBU1512422.1 hypothetical protein [Myxococcota bacterium]
MAMDTTALSGMIHSEYFAQVVEAYGSKAALDSLFKTGVASSDVQGIVQGTDAMKAPAELVTSYDGKSKKVVVPIRPKAVGDTTTLAEGNSDAVETAYTPTLCEVEIFEKGHQKITVTGLAELQTYTPATAEALIFLAECMGETKELMISSLFSSVTDHKAASTSADDYKYFLIDPVETGVGTGIYKPDGALDCDEVRKAVIHCQSNALPWGNGLFLGIIHPEAKYDLLVAAGSDLKDFRNYQAGSPFVSAAHMGVLGVWEGVMWLECANDKLRVVGAGNDGNNLYRTLICGRNYMAKAHVDPNALPFAWKDNGGVQIPFGDFCLRVVPNTQDAHGRGMIITPLFVGGYSLADRAAGIVIVSQGAYTLSAA